MLIDKVSDGPAIMTARLTEIAARQAVIDGLLRDARVQDPRSRATSGTSARPRSRGRGDAKERERILRREARRKPRLAEEVRAEERRIP